ncbi:exocyst complex component 6 [Pieris brassicae]|uniref:exocyst complex component 6 n=1 Tax=Pieris brassicae TaxID=7116 RepID=UPI001E65E948|nr:exocyst complex component 6 [Pieris brassicae]
MTNATIQEIEGIDDYWGPAFRSVYEGEGGHEAFLQQLDERIKQHDKEIEKLCNFYYQGFIESIRELLEVRSHAEELHAEISNVDANVKETTDGLCVRSEELIRARRVELNIASTIEKMELCLPLLTTYSKLKSQVEAKRYYPALKTLEQLEHVLLPRVGPYAWCSHISSDIPKLRQAIQDASMADLRDFLENIRRLSPQVGAVALKQTQEMLGRSLENIIKNKKDMATLGPSSVETNTPQSPHELVDFSPLYRCLHIHTVLGAKHDFVQYYRSQRRQQARLVVIPAAGNLHDSIQSMKSYLNAVLGFFILEEHLLTTGAGLVSSDWLGETWGSARSAAAGTLRTHTALVTDPTLMLSIKHQIVLFINALKCYGLPTEPLPQLLQEMAEHYTEVLMQRWVAVFRDILDNATFRPIEVENQEQYDAVMDTFPYDGDELETQAFPRKFPFSSVVPAVYVQVKEFMYAWLKYSSGLGLGGGGRAAAARHSTSLLLTRSFTGCLSALFRRALPLTQLVQIILDTQYLESATPYLYEFISNITGSDLVTTQPAGSMFQTARDDAEKQICENLQHKVDEFLDLENYDWLLVEPSGQASSFVTDMLGYLTGVLTSLEQLPRRAREAAVTAAVKRIACRLRALLLEGDVRAVSAGALHQLDLDVIQCEQFAASDPLPGLRDQLLEHFASLRQLLDLITSWDWSSYLHDIGMEGAKYALVSPREAATLLEKLREAEQKSSVFSVLKKNERDRRKLLDTVLKQLKQLQNQDG